VKQEERSVEILVSESVFLYVWCGNGVPTPLFSPIHPYLPATFFGKKFSSAINLLLFYRPTFFCL